MKKKKKTFLFGIILLVLALGLGYAFLTTTLNISGTTDVDSNTWNVYWDNVQVIEGSVTAETPVIDSSKTSVTFSVHLSKPGDYFAFNVDAKNDGTIDAMIDIITKTINDSTTIPDYLVFDILYSDYFPITSKQELNAGSKETYHVVVYYDTQINPDELPTTNQSFTLSFGVTYVQKDSSAISIPRPIDFATDSWSIINNAALSGNTSAYHVGDIKEVQIGDYTYHLRIVNNSTPDECYESGFSQSSCGLIVEFVDLYVDPHVMANSTAGGWPSTSMRNYLNTTFFNLLPEDLRSSIPNIHVVSSNSTFGNIHTYETYISTDHIFLISLCEYSLCREQYFAEAPHTRVLDYYATHSTSSDYKKDNVLHDVYDPDSYLTRSGYTQTTAYYGISESGGTIGLSCGYNNAYYFAPAFRIGQNSDS